MKKTVPALILSSAWLTGCAGWNHMEQGLQALYGQPLSAAVQRLGYPDAEQNIAGMRLVVWSRSETWTDNTTHTVTTRGKISKVGDFDDDDDDDDDGDMGGKGKRYTETTRYTVPNVQVATCTIKMQIGEDDIIRGAHYSGGLLACWPYMRALTRGLPNPR